MGWESNIQNRCPDGTNVCAAPSLQASLSSNFYLMVRAVGRDCYNNWKRWSFLWINVKKTQLFVFQWCMSCAMLLLFVCPVRWCVFLTSNTYNSRGLRHALGTSTTIFLKMCLSLRCWTGKAIIVPDAHFQCWHHIPFRSCYFAVRTWHKINPSDFFLLSAFHLLSLYPLMFFFFLRKN